MKIPQYGCPLGLCSQFPCSKKNNWLVVSTQLKNISQNGNLPKVGVKIQYILNHHLDKHGFMDLHTAHNLKFYPGKLPASSTFHPWKREKTRLPNCGWELTPSAKQFGDFLNMYIYICILITAWKWWISLHSTWIIPNTILCLVLDFQALYISRDSWMYPYQRTPMGNPYLSPFFQ